MRILHLLNYTRHANGMVCAAIDLACCQADAGHDVYICSGGGDYDFIFTRHNVKILKINQDKTLRNIPRALLALFKAFRSVKPDIVHAHMTTSALFAAALRPFLPFRLVTSVHNEFQRSAMLMRVGDRVIGVSEAVTQSMIGRGIPARKMRTVLNGTVHSPRFPKPDPAPAPEVTSPSVLFVGGQHPRKGVSDLIEAFGIALKAAPQAKLYLVGNGPHRKEYEALAKERCGDSVIFCGFREDPRPYLMAADIFVLPSHAEPAGLVISEAREFGCAIIGSDVGGIPEMVDHGASGLLVPPRNPAKLAETLTRLLTDAAYLQEMKARSQHNIGHFTVARVAEETEKVYRELVA